MKTGEFGFASLCPFAIFRIRMSRFAILVPFLGRFFFDLTMQKVGSVFAVL